MDINDCLTCRLCGQEHRRIHLEPGQKALCIRCSALLERGARAGPGTALVFSVTGLALSVPAVLLPFVSAGLLGGERVGLLLTGVGRLWHGGMRTLAVLVFVCGWFLPVALLAAFAVMSTPFGEALHGGGFPISSGAVRLLERWAIPEVHVLAVFVALMKLGDVVDLTIGPGFWCYCAMALSLLVARRSFDFDSTLSHRDAAQGGAAP